MNIDKNVLDILRCPVSGRRLIASGENEVATEDGVYRYPIIDGIFILLPKDGQTDFSEEKAAVKRFYEEYGWDKNESDEYNDTALFVNSSAIPRRYTAYCMNYVNKFIPRKGQYLLDAGSGPIPHIEYLRYHDNFSRRVCVDFSLASLLEAKKKLGERGIYIVGDLTKLPLIDGAVDGAVCCHVLYHIPADQQAKAFEEIARVIASGGRGVVVYRWSDSPLSWRIESLFKRLSNYLGRPVDNLSKATTNSKAPPLYFYPHTLDWFLSQAWSFRYKIACFRLIDNFMMRQHIGNQFIWKIITIALFTWQTLMPGFTGKYGLYPIIVIEK